MLPAGDHPNDLVVKSFHTRLTLRH
jgi:hypothetical protein